MCVAQVTLKLLSKQSAFYLPMQCLHVIILNLHGEICHPNAKFPNVDSYWNDWISPVKIDQTTINVINPKQEQGVLCKNTLNLTLFILYIEQRFYLNFL